MFTSRWTPYGELFMKSATRTALSGARAGSFGINVFHGLTALKGRQGTAPSNTSTVAVPLLPGSAWLVATTWHVAEAAGAVYTPAAVIDPQLADQATVLGTSPVTVAWKASTPVGASVTLIGATETSTCCGVEPFVLEAEPQAPIRNATSTAKRCSRWKTRIRILRGRTPQPVAAD